MNIEIEDNIAKIDGKLYQLVPVESQEENEGWEILEFIGYGGIYKLMPWKKMKYSEPHFDRPGHQISLSWALANPNFNIHSVKRLSDGEVFSVGDKMGPIGDFETIKAISLRDCGYQDKRQQVWFHVDLNNMDYGCCLSAADKMTEWKPIFVTEEGVPLFHKEDKVYSVLPKAQWEKQELTAGFLFGAIQNHGGWKTWKHFYTEEARDNYITNHKPVLSLNDIWSAGNYNESNDTLRLISRRTLWNLIKSKL